MKMQENGEVVAKSGADWSQTDDLNPGGGSDLDLDAQAAKICASLKDHLVTTVPTETVEGWAVRLSDEAAIRQLMQAKDRGFGARKIFTLVPESQEAIAKYVLIPDRALPLIKKHIPGELTLVLPKNPKFHNFYYDHYATIGVRIPDHPLFSKILPEVGPLILTSANVKGGTPKSTTGHKPSTVVDFTGDAPKILRQGDLNITF